MASPAGDKETRYLKSVLSERPESLLFARLADVYRKEGNIDQAIQLCINGLNLYPSYTTGRILLGRCFLEQQKTAEAIRAFSMVCIADRRNQVAIKMLADIYARQGMDRKAGDLYALLSGMDPDHPTLRQLCSQFASTGTTDLFAILDIKDSSAGTVNAPSAPGSDHQPVPEGTFIEQPESPVVQYDDGIDTFQAEVAGFDEDVSSGMAEQSSGEIAATDISGNDIADRMSMLFNDQSMQNPSSADPGIPDFPNAPAEPVLEDVEQNSDNVSGTDISDRIEELFKETGGDFGADQESGTVAGPIGVDGYEQQTGLSVESASEPLPIADGVSEGSDEGVSGADISNRLSELFGEEPAAAVGSENVSDADGEQPVADYSTAEEAMDHTASDLRDTGSTVDRDDGFGEDDFSLGNFQMPDSPAFEESTPDFPEPDLAVTSTTEALVLPTDDLSMKTAQDGTEADAQGMLTGDNEGPRADTLPVPDEDDDFFTENHADTNLDGISGDDISERITDVFGSTGQPQDPVSTGKETGTDMQLEMAEAAAAAAGNDIAADMLPDAEIKLEGATGGDDVSDNSSPVFDDVSESTSEELIETMELQDYTVPSDATGEPESLAIDMADNAGAGEAAGGDQTMPFFDGAGEYDIGMALTGSDEEVTGEDIADRIDAFNEPESLAAVVEGEVGDEDGVGGEDVSGRIESIFDGAAADNGTSVQEAAIAGEAAGGDQTMPSFDGAGDDIGMALTGSNEEVTGEDVVDRIATIFSDAADQSEPGDDLAATVSGDEVAMVQDDSNPEDVVTGDDISDRIAGVFDSNTQPDLSGIDFGDTGTGDGVQGDEFYSDVSSEIDELTAPENGNGAIPEEDGQSSASLAEAEDTLFKKKYGSGEPSGDEVLEQDFIAPDFEETMQFDSALFEQMLNPTSQSAPYMRDDAESSVDPASLSDESLATDGIFDEASDSGDRVIGKRYVESGSSDGSVTPDSPVEGAGRENNEVFELVNEMPGDDFGFEVTTEQYPPPAADLIEEPSPPDARLDRTAVFEVNVSETHTDLVIDGDEQVVPESTVAEDAGEDSVEPFNLELIADVPVSDHTESVNFFPVENPSETPGESSSPDTDSAGSITPDKPVPDETFAGVVLVDSNQPDDDEAFIETMQHTEAELFDPGEYPPVEAAHDGTAEFDAQEKTPADNAPVVSGSDVEQRLETMFQGDDLMSLSTETLLPPEDDRNEVLDQVSDFYTISGDNAAVEASGALPEVIDEVEFDARSAIEHGATVELSVEEIRKMMAKERRSVDAAGEVLPEVELYEEIAADTGVAQATDETVIVDKRDKPFDIPDHVLTPTLADIYFQQGQHRLALQIYSRLSERDPDNEKLAARMEEIRGAIDESENSGEQETGGGARGGTGSRKSATGTSSKKRAAAQGAMDERPLAGVRIKKRIKNARKNARKRF